MTLINYIRSISEIPFPPSSSEVGYVGIFPKTLIDKVIWSEILITCGIYYQMEKKEGYGWFFKLAEFSSGNCLVFILDK